MGKNKRLIALLKVNIAIVLFSVMAIDSNSYIPLVFLAVSLAWLLLFTIANTRG